MSDFKNRSDWLARRYTSPNLKFGRAVRYVERGNDPRPARHEPAPTLSGAVSAAQIMAMAAAFMLRRR